MKVAVATTSSLAALAAQEIAEAGGNAVDCAIAAAMLTMNTEPGVCALAGGAYVTVWVPGEAPATIDGNVAIPGKGLPEGHRHKGGESIFMEYGGGVTTLAGPESIGVPGSLAAVDLAARRYGSVPWKQLLQPSIRAARDGFPLSSACHYYLRYSGDTIFGRSRDGHRALHDVDGELKSSGAMIVVPQLADSLEAIAEEGSREFYEGNLGRRIAAHVSDNGGLLTFADLQSYEPLARDSLRANLAGWTIASNPPPAVGGAVLSAMLLAFEKSPVSAWTPDSLRQLIEVQRWALSYRRDKLEIAADIDAEVATLLADARSGQLASRWASSSTVHTSAVDDSGIACAITASSGYGSGEMPAGTGLWLNNCLGELELNRAGLDASPPGARLPSNMAPSIARRKQKVMAAGSPGADRITTALHQFFVNYMQLGLPLADAIAHPRLHFDFANGRPVVATEPGLDLRSSDIALREFPERGMYFGGVGAAVFDEKEGFNVAADPRREGGVFCSS